VVPDKEIAAGPEILGYSAEVSRLEKEEGEEEEEEEEKGGLDIP
jgi:hypothetical protein